MDELNKFKQIWDKSIGDPPRGINRDELLNIISKKTSGPVEKLKRSLYLEIGTILIAIPMLIVAMTKLNSIYFIVNTSILIALFSSILVYYFFNLRKVSAIWAHGQEDIKQNIDSTLNVFRFFRKTYYFINIVLFPAGIYFGFIIGFGLGSGGKKVSSLQFIESLSLFSNLLVIGLFLALLSGVFYLILRFWVKTFYDRHILKLEQIKKELEENN